MKFTFIFLVIFKISFGAFAQNDSSKVRSSSPYTTSFKVDGPVIGAGLGLATLGLSMIQKKDALTVAEVNALSKKDVNGFDRFGAGYYSDKANKDSYLPFYGSFAMPVVALLNKNIGRKAGQVMVLYLETMAITGTMYTLSAGSVVRHRPLVYSTDAPMGKRQSKNSQRSFFAGHTAATAAATFFTAKVFSDFNPDSKARPYVWAAAAIVPASVGYMRLKAGQHFLSDNLLGYGLGAAAGILVPHLHKKKNGLTENLSIQPLMDGRYQGMVMNYRFK
ncbi:MAG: phosphatase PAP2 family protein [Pyrinomonadaceae bacterium]|nr:phosphatase PAP2 family protein [Sphingobacteriaceae bacterium]